jgi:NOL1/NOP2/fmu family ribosome biogenesis protein
MLNGPGLTSLHQNGKGILSAREHRSGVEASCLLELDLGTEERARNVNRSLELDNGEHARTWVEGSVLKMECQAKSLMSLLHTIEDLMACLKVADEMTEVEED